MAKRRTGGSAPQAVAWREFRPTPEEVAAVLVAIKQLHEVIDGRIVPRPDLATRHDRTAIEEGSARLDEALAAMGLPRTGYSISYSEADADLVSALLKAGRARIELIAGLADGHPLARAQEICVALGMLIANLDGLQAKGRVPARTRGTWLDRVCEGFCAFKAQSPSATHREFVEHFKRAHSRDAKAQKLTVAKLRNALNYRMRRSKPR